MDSPIIEDLAQIISLQQEVATSGLALRDLKNLICQRIQPLTRAAGAVVEMVDGEEMLYAAASGVLSPFIGLRLKREASLSGLCVAENKVLYCEDSETDSRVDKEATRRINVRSMICVPLIHQNKPVGVLKVVSPEVSYFRDREIQILTIVAGLLSSSIAQAHAMKLLQDSETKFKTIFENASDGIVVFKDGIITEANAAFSNMFGFTHEEVIGMNIFEIVLPENISKAKENIRLDLNMTIESTCQRKDGSFIYVESRGKNVVLNGETFRVTRILDITERKKFIDSLKSSEAKAREANEIKSQFLANMSHEVRTPLNGILGVTEILSETNLDEDQRGFLDILKKSSHDLLTIVNDILDFSKVSQNKIQLEKMPFDIRSAFTEILSVMKHLCERKNLSFKIQMDENVPETMIGDPTRIKQVLNNLLSNALKFTDQGEVSLHLYRKDQTLVFEVQDTGIGIAPGSEKKIFDPFKQGDTSTTRKYGGTGLGLSICKELIRVMGGDIGVRPAGRGSLFWFELPLLTETASQSETKADFKASQIPLRVLLVEDNEVNALITEKMLEKLGHKCEHALNGLEALEKLSMTTFDVILMDCQMPVMDGFEATRRIRAGNNQYSTIRIVAMTAHAMEGDREKCLDAGMNDYLSKPMKIADLKKILEPITA